MKTFEEVPIPSELARFKQVQGKGELSMKDINKVILIGRLGADPISRQTKAGKAVTQFSIATTRRFFRGEAENGDISVLSPAAHPIVTEETQWHQIVTWGRQAEACAQYLKKGNPVYIEGSIKSHTYETKEGQSKLSFEIQADQVSFLGGRPTKNATIGFEGSLGESYDQNNRSPTANNEAS